MHAMRELGKSTRRKSKIDNHRRRVVFDNKLKPEFEA